MSTATPSTSQNPYKVLISGAGIAGPCFAYWLARSKLPFEITILERSPVPRPTGQSIDIRGASIQIVKDMGLEPAIRACYTTEEGTTLCAPDGKPFATFGAGGKEVFTAEYEILRADLAGLFMKATESKPNVKYIYNEHITSITQHEKSISATLASGSTSTYDLVVGADGSTSRTRSMNIPEDILKDSYHFLGQYLAFFSIPRVSTDNKMWKWYSAPLGRCIMLRPHRNPDTMGAYLAITTPARGTRDLVVEDAMVAGPEATKKVLHEYLDETCWEAKRVLNAMDTADDFYITKAASVKLSKWTNGRGVLLGDAAHATFGAGTTLAIMGAYILAGELSKIESGEEIPRALVRFEQVFRVPYSKEDLPPGWPQLAFPQTSWGLWIRDTLLWAVSKTKVYRLLSGGSDESYKLPEYDWKSF